ncbi:MAG: iron dependent repressor, metal binding and dimerization domain protein [Planctomycetota bacterium]
MTWSSLTEKGAGYARQLIRAHRLAERLLYDILGGDFESGACEFEHTVTGELVDSICILLGHPETCPHGSPIPQGQCCKESCRTAQSSVVPLVELEVGQSARVAYINCKSDQQLHKIDSLCIKPWREPQHFRLAGKEPLGQPDRKKNGRSISRHGKQGTHPIATLTTAPLSRQSSKRKGIICYFRSKLARQE